MFESSIVKGLVHTDNTGVAYQIPILLTPNGPLEILVDYLVACWGMRSPSWMYNVASATRLFLEYLEVHSDYSNPLLVFQNFRHRLLTGSIDHLTGQDPSELWWHARSPKQSSRIINTLTDLLNWFAKQRPNVQYPWVGTTAHEFERRIAEAAYQYRRNSAFLGNTWSPVAETSKNRHATSSSPRKPAVETERPPSFPEDRILDLIFKGFKVGKRYNYRNMLITLLLNGAGFRASEPFHLYFWDVIEDPANPGRALVLIHHPSSGDAPPDPSWTDLSGKQRNGQRIKYLAEMYGLQPRDKGLSTDAAGWKGGMHESRLGGYYKQAYWFVPEFGQIFWEIWNLYIQQVQRISPSLRNHPFAFINTAREPVGDVYKLGKFEDSHADAVRRIGLVPAKHLGTSTHGHRHAYGQRLRRAGIQEEFIRRFMHHANIESQQIYTQPDHGECLEHIANGLIRLNQLPDEQRRRIISIEQSNMLIKSMHDLSAGSIN